MTDLDVSHLLLSVAGELRVLANPSRDGTPERKRLLNLWANMLDEVRVEHLQLQNQQHTLQDRADAAERWVKRRQLREQMTAAALTGILARGEHHDKAASDLACAIGAATARILRNDPEA